MVEQMDNYTIKIEQFEGPFDLLLFFIERDELNIHDIPISKITQDFLDYIRQLEELNIDVASEFILVAATLMRIKAKMLLPRRELDLEGHEIDPRHEIAQKLLEYRKFKSTLDDFKILEHERTLFLKRGNVKEELKAIAQKAMIDSELESLNLFKLLKTFQRMLKDQTRRNKKLEHIIIDYPYTVEEQEKYVSKILCKKNSANFEDIFEKLENMYHAIITFLAMLEMINAQKISITSGQNTNQIIISLRQN